MILFLISKKKSRFYLLVFLNVEDNHRVVSKLLYLNKNSICESRCAVSLIFYEMSKD